MNLGPCLSDDAAALSDTTVLKFKVLLVGGKDTGKSSILSRFINRRLPEALQSTCKGIG